MIPLSEASSDELVQEIKKRFEEKDKSYKELSALYDELIMINKKLAESEKLKSNFLSNIRNEIINPFSSIVLLSKQIIKVPKEDWKKVINIAALIHSEAFFLDFQLRNIFAAAELEAGEALPQISKCNITSIIESVIESYFHLLKNKRISLSFENYIPQNDRNFFRTDADKLQLIVSNLINNAIQNSHDDGKVIVTAEIKNSILYITVKDFGIGINEEYHKIIFDRFSRVNTAIDSFNKGHGLGLAVCKDWLNLLGGSITVESSSEVGSKFVIEIPEHNKEVPGVSDQSNEILFDDFELF